MSFSAEPTTSLADDGSRKEADNSHLCDGPIAELFPRRTLFTSRDWRYDEIRNLRNLGSVKMTNRVSGATVQMAVESDDGPGYRVSFQSQQVLPKHMVETLRPWIEDICQTYARNGIEPPPPLPTAGRPVPLGMSIDIVSDPGERHVRAEARIRLGDTLEAEVALGALGGSVEVTARGTRMPTFLFDNRTSALRKVEMINIHRDGRDGAREAILTTLDGHGEYRSEGISFGSLGTSGEVVVPLVFPGGVLTTPAGVDANRKLNEINRYLTEQMEVAVLAGLAAILLSTNGKYKCLRSTLNLLGASLFCAIGIAATGPTPAVIGAIALCFGSKVLAAVDLILNHLGVEA